MATAGDFTVLVVDDEPDVLTYLKMALEDAGFQVMAAADGEEALRRLAERRPDFISLDLVMPRKSGIRLLHELRRKKEWASIPVMIVTAHARDDLGSKDLQDLLADKILSGPEAYLEKPVKALDYVNLIKRKLGLPAPEQESGPWPGTMREAARDLLSQAGPEALQQVLEVLKKNPPAK